MIQHYLGLASKGLANPQRIPSYLTRKSKAKVCNVKYERYRRREGIEPQTQYIQDFINQDEFALVVLDACRYDYFNRLYRDYIEGELVKLWSPANRTPTWVPQTWSGEYDLTYISSNPYIGEFEYSRHGYQYCASDHIANIVEVWDYGWDEELSTTPPEAVTQAALAEAATADDTRLVVHYIQPHQPYIGETSISPWVNDPKPADTSVSEAERKAFLENTDKVTLEEEQKYQITWGDARKYNIDRPDHGVSELIKHGQLTDEKLQRAYRDNLDVVLEDVQRLVSQLECPVVVTSDHGDLLGEDGRYMHDPITHPLLREVPWLVVDEEIIGIEPNSVPADSREQAQSRTSGSLEDRLAHLGYQ